jgi:hypothetical protein
MEQAVILNTGVSIGDQKTEQLVRDPPTQPYIREPTGDQGKEELIWRLKLRKYGPGSSVFNALPHVVQELPKVDEVVGGRAGDKHLRTFLVHKIQIREEL